MLKSSFNKPALQVYYIFIIASAISVNAFNVNLHTFVQNGLQNLLFYVKETK